MGKLAEILIRSGLVDGNSLAEFERWGMPLPDEPSDDARPVLFPEEVVNGIEEALQNQGMVITRETDLEAIPQYLSSMQEAVLHVVIAEHQEDFAIHVGKNPRGEFLLPWRSDSITDVLTNGETYLLTGSRKVFFQEARELFYGETKAFVVCTPSGEEDVGEGEEGA